MGAADAAGVGKGTTVAFGTTSFSAQIIGEIAFDNLSRESYEAAHMGTTTPATSDSVGNVPYLTDTLVEPGGCTLNIHFNPDTVVPIHYPTEVITFTYPSAATWVISGFIDGYQPTVPVRGKMTATVHVKFTASIKITASTS